MVKIKMYYISYFMGCQGKIMLDILNEMVYCVYINDNKGGGYERMDSVVYYDGNNGRGYYCM